jgi:hypothetical protein
MGRSDLSCDLSLAESEKNLMHRIAVTPSIFPHHIDAQKASTLLIADLRVAKARAGIMHRGATQDVFP